jgi:hypothetical protein
MVAPQAFHEEKAAAGYPHPFGSAQEMLAMGKATGKTIAEMKWANETANASPAAVRRDLDAVWQAMDDCIERGLRMEGELARRAAGEAAGEGDPRATDRRTRDPTSRSRTP